MSPLQKEISKALRQHISQQIKAKRKKASMTLNELSASLGYLANRKIVGSWEYQLAFPPLSAVYLMAMVFDCSVQDFLPSLSDIITNTEIKISRVSINTIDFDDETSEASQ